MNGADLLCDTLLANGIDVCFANPGTSEMHFVAALDRKPQMRCVLGLFEGVVTAAADGYARMADKPAATLLHLGPGLANGLANLHNARRAHTPMINIVGDHATYHLKHDAPLTSDIDNLARPMSCWVGRATAAHEVRARTEQAYLAALAHPGVATLILHADAAWGGYEGEAPTPAAVPMRPKVEAAKVREAAAMLRGGRRSAIILGGTAMRAAALDTAGKIAAGTGATLLTQRAARWERGAGRVTPTVVPYPVDHALRTLKEFESVILIGGTAPVAFFAYPEKPGTLLPEGCEVLELAGQEHDLPEALAMLADELGVGGLRASGIHPYTAPDLASPTGALTPDAIAVAVARSLPEGAIVCDEGITSTRRFSELAATAAPHDHLPITGGAIGIGIPLATGAAVASPGRKVIGLQADGSGMYTLQALWTQARENLDVVTIVYSNRGYAILKGEMRNVGVNDFGRNARRMLEIEDPALDWCSLAKGMGVEAARAETAEDFTRLFKTALSRKGPFLIEAVI